MVYLYRLTIPTPHQHPGYNEYFFTCPEPGIKWLELFNAVEPMPDKGKAFETEKRQKYAEWKRRMLSWLHDVQMDITWIKPTDF